MNQIAFDPHLFPLLEKQAVSPDWQTFHRLTQQQIAPTESAPHEEHISDASDFDEDYTSTHNPPADNITDVEIYSSHSEEEESTNTRPQLNKHVPSRLQISHQTRNPRAKSAAEILYQTENHCRSERTSWFGKSVRKYFRLTACSMVLCRNILRLTTRTPSSNKTMMLKS